MIQNKRLAVGITFLLSFLLGFPDGSAVKNPAANAGDVGCQDPLEKDVVTHSSILAWKIP